MKVPQRINLQQRAHRFGSVGVVVASMNATVIPESIELRQGEPSRLPAQDFICAAEFSILALQGVQAGTLIRLNVRSPAGINV